MPAATLYKYFEIAKKRILSVGKEEEARAEIP